MRGERLTADGTSAIRDQIRERYRRVAACANGHFPYPVGRESLHRLGYEPAGLSALPAEVVEGYVGVGRPFAIRRPAAGERVLDVGCGSGVDTLLAALAVGPGGVAVGIDSTRAMLERPARAARSRRAGPARFVAADAEALPFEDDAFDLVVSNGVLNLVPDKGAAFREVRRVLRPGGCFAAADLLVVEDVPEAVLEDVDAWSN